MSNLLLTVLSDGETFGGADGSSIVIGPNEDSLNQETLSELRDGELPMVAVETWPYIYIKLTSKGDLVAQVNGLGDGLREIQLASREQIARVA